MIFKKKKIKSLIFNNRIVVSPMCQYSSINGSPSKWHYQHLSNLIKSGAGSMVVESTAVSKVGRISNKDLCLFNNTHLKKHKSLIKYLKKINNIPIILQLSHSGRKGSSFIPWIKANTPLPKNKSWKTFAPSPIRRDINWPVPNKLNYKQIKEVVSDFTNSSKLAYKAGYDGVEIHMAHGYLLHQFFSPISNRRRDSYGGSRKKRAKILIDIINEIKKITPQNKIIGARVTGSDHLKKGINENDCIYLINEIEKKGLNYACISSGGIIPITNMKIKRGFRIKIAKKIKKKTKVIIRSSGLIYPKSFMNKIIKDNSLDFIAIGRKFISKNNWLNKDIREKSYGKKVPNQYLRCF